MTDNPNIQRGTSLLAQQINEALKRIDDLTKPRKIDGKTISGENYPETVNQAYDILLGIYVTIAAAAATANPQSPDGLAFIRRFGDYDGVQPRQRLSMIATIVNSRIAKLKSDADGSIRNKFETVRFSEPRDLHRLADLLTAAATLPVDDQGLLDERFLVAGDTAYKEMLKIHAVMLAAIANGAKTLGEQGVDRRNVEFVAHILRDRFGGVFTEALTSATTIDNWLEIQTKQSPPDEDLQRLGFDH